MAVVAAVAAGSERSSSTSASSSSSSTRPLHVHVLAEVPKELLSHRALNQSAHARAKSVDAYGFSERGLIVGPVHHELSGAVAVVVHPRPKNGDHMVVELRGELDAYSAVDERHSPVLGHEDVAGVHVA